jgi:hypothetical protein
MKWLHSDKAWFFTSLAVICFPLFTAITYAQNCDPACRPGYECKNGTCVSMCNPPCPENQNCDPKTHDCVPVATAPVESNEHHNTGGFATGSAISGFIVSPIILGLAIGAAATTGDGLVPSLPLGATALGLGIITVPIFAAGGASARSGEKVKGLLALRIAGWCGYGLAIGTGAAMVGLAIGGATVPPALIIPCGILGTISCLSLSIDAFVSGKEAKQYYAGVEKSGSSPELTLGVGPYRNNGATMQLGLRF